MNSLKPIDIKLFFSKYNGKTKKNSEKNGQSSRKPNEFIVYENCVTEKDKKNEKFHIGKTKKYVGNINHGSKDKDFANKTKESESRVRTSKSVTFKDLTDVSSNFYDNERSKNSYLNYQLTENPSPSVHKPKINNNTSTKDFETPPKKTTTKGCKKINKKKSEKKQTTLQNKKTTLVPAYEKENGEEKKKKKKKEESTDQNISNNNPKEGQGTSEGASVNPMKWHQFPPPEEAINMTRRQLGPYYQYADPPQASKDMIIKIKKKLREEKRLQDAKRSKNYNDGHVREKYNIVIGRLKAADAMQRIHVVSLKFGLKIDMKLNKMVYVQPTGLMAVRTEYLIRSRPLEYLPGGKLNPASRNHQYYLNLKEKSRLKTLLNEIIL